MQKYKIKILHIIESINSNGGTPNKLLMFCQSIDKTKYEITLAYFLENDHLKNDFISAKVNLIKLKHANLLMVNELVQIIKGRKIDIINTHFNRSNIFGTIAGIITKKPVIQYEHGIPRGFTKNKISHKIMKRVDNFLNKFRKAIICNSYTVKDEVLKTSLLDISKLYVVQNAIDIEKFQENYNACNGLTYSRYDEEQNIVNIGAVGGFTYLRDFQLLIRSFNNINKKYSNTRLYLVGDGKYKHECEELVKELGIIDKVNFLGYINDIPCFLKFIDIYIDVVLLAAGVGLALMEPMLAGKPVIGFMGGDERDIILKKPGIGIHLEQNNVELLTQTLDNLILNKEKRITIGKKAAFYIKSEHNPQRYIKEICDIYVKVLNI